VGATFVAGRSVLPAAVFRRGAARDSALIRASVVTELATGRLVALKLDGPPLVDDIVATHRARPAPSPSCTSSSGSSGPTSGRAGDGRPGQAGRPAGAHRLRAPRRRDERSGD